MNFAKHQAIVLSKHTAYMISTILADPIMQDQIRWNTLIGKQESSIPYLRPSNTASTILQNNKAGRLLALANLPQQKTYDAERYYTGINSRIQLQQGLYLLAQNQKLQTDEKDGNRL